MKKTTTILILIIFTLNLTAQNFSKEMISTLISLGYTQEQIDKLYILKEVNDPKEYKKLYDSLFIKTWALDSIKIDNLTNELNDINYRLDKHHLQYKKA